MKLLGLIPEPPFDPHSWSGSSSHFFRALQRKDLLIDAREVAVARTSEILQKVLEISWPLSRWRERYHSSVSRFSRLTRAAAGTLADYPGMDGVMPSRRIHVAPRTRPWRANRLESRTVSLTPSSK